MAEKSYYIEFTFTEKQTQVRREAIVEVPRDVVRRKQTELIDDRRVKAVALDLARGVALTAFSANAERVIWPYDEDALWHNERVSLMEKRACDHEENGMRVWRIA